MPKTQFNSKNILPKILPNILEMGTCVNSDERVLFLVLLHGEFGRIFFKKFEKTTKWSVA